MVVEMVGLNMNIFTETVLLLEESTVDLSYFDLLILYFNQNLGSRAPGWIRVLGIFYHMPGIIGGKLLVS